MSITVPQYVVPQDSQPHVRIGIRKWVKELMKVNTDLGGRWYASRPNPVFLEELPCGLVYFTDEPASHENTAPRTYKRTLALTTEVLHRMKCERDNALDDFLDSRAYEIENAMMADRFLGQQGIIEDTELLRTQPTTIEDEGDDDIASLRIFWNITYRVDAFNKAKLDEFLRFINTIEVGGNNTVDAVDNVTIREE